MSEQKAKLTISSPVKVVGKTLPGRVVCLSGSENTCMIRYADGNYSSWINQDLVSGIPESEFLEQIQRLYPDKKGSQQGNR